MKKFKVYFVILILTVLATGCSKRQDVEDQSFVMAMGIERNCCFVIHMLTLTRHKVILEQRFHQVP